MMDRMNKLLSSSQHLYVVLALLALYGVTVIAVLLYPQDTRLAMAKDVGTTFVYAFGIVAGAHSSKAIFGTKPVAADPPSEGDK